MKANTWLNTKNGQYYGQNTILGSPRGWVQRALGQKSDLFLHSSSLDPRHVTVAGIWRRGESLPDTGSWPAIYRRFRICDDIRHISRARPQEIYPVTGMGVAVPADDIFSVYNLYRETALWVWFDWAVPDRPKLVRTEERTQLDHEEIYRLLDAGYKVGAIAEMMNTHRPSIYYVAKKWQDGIPIGPRKPKVYADHSSVVQDLRMGRPVAEIVARHNISRTMVYKIKQRYQV